MTKAASPVVLAVDAGNSTVTIGLFIGDHLAASLSLPSGPTRSSRAFYEAWKDFLAKESAALPAGISFRAAGARAVRIGAILSSVVPALTAPLSKALARVAGSAPIILSAQTPCGLSFPVPQPDQIGPDRIANAVAASFRAGGPAAVADLGTATTITVVGRHADFLGGAIMPGLGLMAKALHSGTGRLPLAPPDTLPPPLGRDTEDAIRAGIVRGTAGAVTHLVSGIEKQLGFDVQLFLTGGYGSLISRSIGKEHFHVPDLTLEGLRIICTFDSSGIHGSRRTHKGGFAR